jgi:hypothetical protein
MGIDSCGYGKQESRKKYLDSAMKIPYIHAMIIMNLLTLKHVLRAAWRTDAVAEGGFF